MSQRPLIIIAILLLISFANAMPYLFACGRNLSEIAEDTIVRSGSTYGVNSLVDYRIYKDASRMFFIENVVKLNTGVSKLLHIPDLNEPNTVHTLIDLDTSVNGTMCGMSNVASNGNVFAVSFLHGGSSTSAHVKVFTVDATSIVASAIYKSAANIPVLSVNGTYVGEMNTTDASTVSPQGPCMPYVIYTNQIGALLLHSTKGSVVVARFYDDRLVTETVLIPQVVDVVPDIHSVGKLKADRSNSFLYALVPLKQEAQVAFEMFHSLSHNTIIRFPQSANANTTVNVLFKINGSTGTIVAIKQISLFSEIGSSQLIDMDIYMNQRERNSTMHIIGTVKVNQNDKFLYLKYSNIERTETMNYTDPDYHLVFNLTGSVAPYPKSITASDETFAFIAGGSAPGLFGRSNAYLGVVDSQMGQTLKYVWGESSDLYSSNIQLYNDKTYYIETKVRDDNDISSTISAKWCKLSPSPSKSPSPDKKFLIALILGISIPVIVIAAVALAAVLVCLTVQSRRKRTDSERLRLM